MNSMMITSALLIAVFPLLTEQKWGWLSGSSSSMGEGYFYDKNESNPNATPSGCTNIQIVIEETTGSYYSWGGTCYNGLSNNIWRFDYGKGINNWLSGDSTAYSSPMFATRLNVAHRSNTPGGREYGSSFFRRDDGSFYVFGGIVSTSQATNTVFKLSFSDGLWSWVSGKLTSNAPGVFGELGVPGNGAEPPNLFSFAYGYDINARQMYVFGGGSYVSGVGGFKKYSQMWRYDVMSGNWTWMNGIKEDSQKGFYGNKTIPSPLNYPGARIDSASTYDPVRQEWWIFGGNGFNALFEGMLNDLWKYSVQDDVWTFVGGERAVDSNGRDNGRLIYTSSNSPRARMSSSLVINPETGALYLFGGSTIRGSVISLFNDLWKFSQTYNMWTLIGGSSTGINAPGQFGTKGVFADSSYPPSKQGAGYAFDPFRKGMVVFSGARAPSGLGNDLWLFIDDGPDGVLREEDDNELTVTSSTRVSTSIPPRDRTRFSGEELETPTTSVPIGLVIGISAGVGLFLVVVTLIIMTYIRRNSMKEAVLAGANTAPGDTVTDGTGTVLDDETQSGLKMKLGSSTLDLSVVKAPAPLIRYSPNSVAAAKESIPGTMQFTGYDYDAVLQIGTQNGAALYNGLSVASTLKALSDKVTIKVFGKNVSSLESGVEDSFWEEAALLLKLEKYPEAKFTHLLGYSLEPVALLFPSYPYGTLEQYLTSQQQLHVNDVFYIVSDVIKTLKFLHELGYAHRNVKLRTIFIGKEKRLSASLSAFNGLQHIGDDERKAINAYPNYRIDAKAANFVAPEVFSAIRGQTPSINPAMALKSGDLFSWAMLISKLMKYVK
ncbi:hypothetical protein MP638_004346 [Amoeboaphelidium occidentale]|nr:hypothetical protein MP638_004346 [Amoeboaphelidium occidentale]